MKQKVIRQSHEICIERAILITESYRKTKRDFPVIRFAKAIKHILQNMTIKIWDDEVIVGNRCSKLVGTPLYPEIRVDTLEQDCDSYDSRSVQPLFLSDEDRQILKEDIIPYWKHEEQTVQHRYYGYLNDDEKTLLEKLLFIVDAELTNGVGHFFPGHENVLKYGINGLIQKS